MIQAIKRRLSAKKFNIWTEKIDQRRESDGWLMGDWYVDGTLYYGHPFFIFFKSSQNSWFKSKYPNGLNP